MKKIIYLLLFLGCILFYAFVLSKESKVITDKIPTFDLTYVDSVSTINSNQHINVDETIWKDFSLNKITFFNPDFRFVFIAKCTSQPNFNILILEQNSGKEIYHWIITYTKNWDYVDHRISAFSETGKDLFLMTIIKNTFLEVIDFNNNHSPKLVRSQIRLTSIGKFEY